MVSKKESAFDPARSLELLWRTNEKPSRSGLTVDSIVAAAIELADAEGLDAVSMRRLADALGVGAMSLYTHVPGKAELTDLMVDSALGSLYSTVDEPKAATEGWREGLRFVAERNWTLYQRHSWLLDAQGPRAVLGPHTIEKYEAELRVIDGVGLSDVDMDSVLALVLTHVTGTARALARFNRVREESGMTDAQWWESTSPVLERVMGDDRYPLASRVGTAAATSYDAASDPVHEYEFGVERILDGVAALIDRA
ncbi:TetR/AcrR family transcriptional regulator [Rhodococcus sp. BP-252]|uniref:TetR/AcrR family transcriptional regulator n=1 Tax=unclassified Rhodococcus (in: high G+C Gram-positive bacteria) TaxID=192944 RepID=UPI001C9A5F21|nr:MULTISPECIES: TetR/AcrR family transcriptional regulator [unclassified Rhodococcus (in: high G+C Gram-positive bacteria)]MBY6412903.1 TetR/AcrR family transcriptional regulator [Rhodococcus sp. BP-320]MBY6417560.1 TetR/AcrR family transcriptional regulator [Rhodococcus sp. BP-321]MBY6423068.1 TetR/AcrR family transcriptional regulator [Rhodococcus sp. BP-324]MBY6427584.1 TetR/AcrR family transcriptional regulator [Rhodococcus sp. BP-323]MBY6432748.1 TetR/AcrR family transcriptional regulato